MAEKKDSRMNQTMSDDIPQDQVEAVYHAIASGLSFDAPTRKIAEEVIRVLTPMIAAVYRSTLREHWLAEIRCNHDARTDRALCACSLWRDEEHPNVGAAVDAWVEHVIAESIRAVKGAVT